MASVLIIDDDRAIRELLKGLLTSQGHDVRVACDGREAVFLFNQAPDDLVISDVYMPNEDGIGLMREIRTIKPGTPFLMISGGDTSEFDALRMAQKLGANAVLRKPVSPKDLFSSVTACLA